MTESSINVEISTVSSQNDSHRLHHEFDPCLIEARVLILPCFLNENPVFAIMKCLGKTYKDSETYTKRALLFQNSFSK